MKLKFRAKCVKGHIIEGNAYSSPKGFMCEEHRDELKSEEIKTKPLPKSEIHRIKKSIKF